MIVRLGSNTLVLTAENPGETEELESWLLSHDGHLMLADIVEGRKATLRLIGQGHHLDYAPTPLNILHTAEDEDVRLISNLGFAPFHLDGRHYASVEGFWQGLKLDDASSRAKLTRMHGMEAKRAGSAMEYPEIIRYEGHDIIPGTYPHRKLMFRACHAKFTQNAAARAALLRTGNRPLVHKPRRDSKTIPGALMADCWMKLRQQLQRDELDGEA